MVYLLLFLYYSLLALLIQGEDVNPLLQHCAKELAQLYSPKSEEDMTDWVQRRQTLICPLPKHLQTLSSHQLLSIASRILNCDQLPYRTSVHAKMQKDRSVLLGCLNPFEDGELTLLSASLGPTSAQWLYLSRQHRPLSSLPYLPELTPKYRRFPILDLRLPADFFYPFDGCT